MDIGGICVPKQDPNLCTKAMLVKVESKDSFGWNQLKKAFKELNLKLPTPYPSKFKTEIHHVCCLGYSRQTDDEPCKPLCLDKCDKNSYCSKPNVCECVSGYEKVNGSCQRVCERTCPANSTCRDGEFCECNTGFEMVNGNCVEKTTCPADCGANSFCGESGLCECQMNYHVAPGGLCVKDTTEFLATDPHVCSIKRTVNYINLSSLLQLLSIPGKAENLVSSKIEVLHFCCPGYEQQTNGNLCQPKCGKECADHCRCIGPDTCQCDTDVTPNQDMCQCVPGYTKSPFGSCQPVCSAGCPAYSSCIRPEQCKCHEGYSNSSNSFGNFSSCQPICPPEIPENGRCVRPGEWECDPGYIKLARAQGEGFYCAPHCQESCFTFASCVAPNVCKCLPGYTTTTIVIEPNESRDLCVRINGETGNNLRKTKYETT